MDPHPNKQELSPKEKIKTILHWFSNVFRATRSSGVSDEVAEQLVAKLSEAVEISPDSVRFFIKFMVDNFHGDKTAKYLWDLSHTIGDDGRMVVEDRLAQHLYQRLQEQHQASSTQANLSSSVPSDNSMSISNRVLENQFRQPQDLSASLDSTLTSTGISRHQQYPSLQSQALSSSIDRSSASIGGSRHQEYQLQQPQAPSASIDRSLASIDSSRHQENQSQLTPGSHENLRATGAIPKNNSSLSQQVSTSNNNRNLSTTMPAMSSMPQTITWSDAIYQSQLTPGSHENLQATGAIPKDNSSLSQQVSTSNNNRNLRTTMPAMSSMAQAITWSDLFSNEKRPSSPDFVHLNFSEEMKRFFRMPESRTPDTNNSSATNETLQSSSEYSSPLGSTDPIERLMMMPKCKTPDTNSKIDSLMMNPRWKFPDANYILGDADPSLSSFESQQRLSERNRNSSNTGNRNMANTNSEFGNFGSSSSRVDTEIVNDIKMCFQRVSDECNLPLNSGASNLSSTEQSSQYGLTASSRVSEGGFDSPYLQLDVSDGTLQRLGWNTDPTRNINLDEDFSYDSYEWKVDGRKLSLHVKTAESSNYDIPWSTNDGSTEFNKEPIPMPPNASTTINSLDAARGSLDSNVGAATECAAMESVATEDAANTQHSTTDIISEENRQPRFMSPDVESTRTNLDLTSRSCGNVNINNCTEDASNTQLNNTDNNLERSSGAVLGLASLDWPIVCEFNVNKFSHDLSHQDSSQGHVSFTTGVLGKPYYQDMPVDGTRFSPDTNFEQYTVDEKGYLRGPNNGPHSVDETGNLHNPNYGHYFVDEAGILHYPIYGQYPVDGTGFSHDPNLRPYPVHGTGSSLDPNHRPYPVDEAGFPLHPNSRVNPETETRFTSGVASNVLESEQDRSYNNNSNWDEFETKVYQPPPMTLVDFVPSEITVVKTKKTKKKERAMRAAAAAAENTSESSNNSPSLSPVTSSLKDLNLGNNNLNVLEETQNSVSPPERTQSNMSPTEQAQSIASTSEQEQNRASTSEQEQNRASTSEQEQNRASTSEQEQIKASTSEQEKNRASTSEQEQNRASTSEQEQNSASTSKREKNSASTSEQEQTILFKSENVQSSGSPSKQSQTNVSAVNQHQRDQRGGRRSRGGGGDSGDRGGRGGRGSSGDRGGHEGSDERGGRGDRGGRRGRGSSGDRVGHEGSDERESRGGSSDRGGRRGRGDRRGHEGSDERGGRRGGGGHEDGGDRGGHEGSDEHVSPGNRGGRRRGGGGDRGGGGNGGGRGKRNRRKGRRH